MRRWLFLAAVLLAAAIGGWAVWNQLAPRPRNVIIFVADGLRSEVVTEATAPALQAVRREGVDFRYSHSIFPTVTTPNASVIATGHLLGDTGNFGNFLYAGETSPPRWGPWSRRWRTTKPWG